MSTFTPEQQTVIRTINQEARRRYGSDPSKRRRYTLTQFEIAGVESNYTNLPGGDADSAGYRQERGSLYHDPTNLKASINRAFDEMEQHDRGQPTGTLAADVQRPAAQYRGRYQLKLGEARTLAGGGDNNPAQGGQVFKETPPTLNRGGTKTDTRGAVTAALLDKRKGMSLVSRMQEALSSGQYTTTTLPKVTAGKYSVGQASTPAGGGDAKARADAIDSKKLPYSWGGGHGGKVDAFNAAPLDCSGAVSAVLGINPRVSGEFTKWGKAGDGGSKGITVYANGHHVIMKINGHFFGTSASNPGGGAGWIKASNISPSYLAGFTARHA